MGEVARPKSGKWAPRSPISSRIQSRSPLAASTATSWPQGASAKTTPSLTAGVLRGPSCAGSSPSTGGME